MSQRQSLFDELDSYKINDIKEIVRILSRELDRSIYHQDAIEIIGRGQGANKSNTTNHGETYTEDFGVNSEIFVQWAIPASLDRLKPVIIHLGGAPVASESGKNVSFEIHYKLIADGDTIGDNLVVETVANKPVPDTALVGFSLEHYFPDDLFRNSSAFELHLKIKRVAATNDLVSDYALHHLSVEHFRLQRWDNED
jgi:hypothetical protein